MSITFEWDASKAARNMNKHGVSFDEATTVFQDPLAAILDDEDHSSVEHREIMISHSAANRLGPVFFTERIPDIVRIISARRATQKELHDYEENR